MAAMETVAREQRDFMCWQRKVAFFVALPIGIALFAWALWWEFG